VCTRGNDALGLVYSDAESISAALASGAGAYHSRSRGGLWRKGETSGRRQTLHRINADSDALRFKVTQEEGGGGRAAFCHLNTLSCWGEPRGIRHLEETLMQRLGDDANSPDEGSYTKRLFNDDSFT
jgi:phosphoribosyl-ATP pyrophosphohydrolase/phosphoribosyl-AMP cyclohydrolase/histidinol dehydrogenase